MFAGVEVDRRDPTDWPREEWQSGERIVGASSRRRRSCCRAATAFVAAATHTSASGLRASLPGGLRIHLDRGVDRRRRAAGARRHPGRHGRAGLAEAIELGARHDDACTAAAVRGDVDDAGGGIRSRRMGDVRPSGFTRIEATGRQAFRVAAVHGRVERRHEQPLLGGTCECQAFDLGRVVDEVVGGASDALVRRRLGRERLRRRQLLARHLGRRHRTLLEAPDRRAGVAVERVEDRLLRGLEHARYPSATHGHVHGDRRRRRVVVPHVVMHHLVVPDALPCLHVERDETGGKQVVAGTEPTVDVLCGAVGRHVDDAAFGIGGERRPRRDVAGRAPGVVLPGLMADLAGPRNHMELPQELAGLGIVGDDVARYVLLPRLVVTLLGGVADDDDVVHHDRR